MTIIRADPADDILIGFDWADVLVAGVTLSAVEHTVPAPLERVAQATNAVAATSTVRVRGFVHGKVYSIAGKATLSNGEVIERSITARGWNE